ncbi:hypothetical protein SNE85_000808 [Vibrio cholerae]|nr:hypothetical protein [Vibrio cholerae]
MANVEYKNMASGTAKNGADYLEVAVGALNVGDVVIKVIPPRAPRGFRAPRGKPVTTIETYTVTSFGGEFYSQILNCDAVRA